jgi:hypothetical protein
MQPRGVQRPRVAPKAGTPSIRLVVSPARSVQVAPKVELPPLHDVDTQDSPRNAPSVAAIDGAALIVRRFDKDRQVQELTQRQETSSVGDWLFGRGGIRGLWYVLILNR